MTEVKSKLDESRSMLIEERRKKNELIERLQKKIVSSSSFLKELEEASRKLENLLYSLGRGLDKKTGRYSATSDFAGLKKNLAWPVAGKTIIGSGKGGASGLMKPTGRGIVIKAELGEHVRTVYEGKVLFADWFKGYGKLVIVDHGRGFYTLYGNLGKIHVREKDFLGNRGVVGFVGSTSFPGYPSLYFGLRKDGVELNPLDWLKKKN